MGEHESILRPAASDRSANPQGSEFGLALSGKLTALLFLAAMVCVFYIRILMAYPSIWGWGNFTPPPSAYASSIQFHAIFWNPFQYNGAPTLSPVTTALGLTFTEGPLSLLSAVFGFAGAVDLFIVGSTLFLAGSFYLLSGRFVSISSRSLGLSVRLVSTAFFLFNPLMISILSAGDFSDFIAQGFGLLSIWLLDISIQNREVRPWVFLASVATLTLTVIAYQVVLLESILYIGYLVCKCVFSGPGETASLRLGRLAKILIRFCLVYSAFLAPFLLGAYSGAYSLSGTSAIAPSLGNFRAFSWPVPSVLFLMSYNNVAWTSTQSSLGVLGYLALNLGLGLLISLLLLGGWLIRNRRLEVLSVACFSAALLGSGPNGPLDELTVYLFVHFPGYASLNASYYWGWLVLSPLYALALLELLQVTLVSPDRVVRDTVALVPFSSRLRFSLPELTRKRIFTAEVILVALLLLVPLGCQGYYGEGGIQNQVPSSLGGLGSVNSELESLVSGTGQGAAVFPWDNQLVNLSTNSVVANPYTSYPTYKSPWLPVYDSPPLAYNSFFYWAYQNLYGNTTSDLPQLLSLADIKFYAALYGLGSDSFGFATGKESNDSGQLLAEQTDLKLLDERSTYAIYTSTLNVAPAYAVNNFTLVDGNYNTLNQMASVGVNLSKSAILFPSDLLGVNLTWVLGKVSQVVLSSPQSWLDLALATLGSDCTNPANYVGTDSSWTSSIESPNGYPYYFQTGYPFAYTSTSGNLSVPLPAGGATQPNQYYVLVRFDTANGGSLAIRTPGGLRDLNTKGTYDNLTNSFIWTEINPGGQQDSESVDLDSMSGFNAVGPICAVNPSLVSQRIQLIEHSLEGEGARLIFLANAATLGISPKALASGSFYGSSGTSATPGGEYLYLSSSAGYTPAVNVSLPFSGGILDLQAMANNGGLFRSNGSSLPATFGWGNGLFSSAAYSWIQVPAGGASQTGELSLTNTAGAITLGEILYATPPVHVSPSLIAPNLGNLSSVYIPSDLTVSDFEMNETIRNGSAIISGSYSYTNATGTAGPSINFEGLFPYNDTIFVDFNTSTSIIATMNGVAFGGSSGQTPYAISPPFYAKYSPGTNPHYAINLNPTVESSAPVNVNFTVTIRGASPLVLPGTSFVDNTLPLFDSVTPTFTGYDVAVGNSSIVLITNAFFSTLSPGSGSAEPALGGLNTLWIRGSSAASSVSFVSNQVSYTAIGLTVTLVVTCAYGIWVVIPAIKRRLSKFFRSLPL